MNAIEQTGFTVLGESAAPTGPEVPALTRPTTPGQQTAAAAAAAAAQQRPPPTPQRPAADTGIVALTDDQSRLVNCFSFGFPL